jgi:hypothetical protein
MNELTVTESAYQLIKPKDITDFSKVLRDFITKSQLSTKIQGNLYVNVDGWKFAGLNFGLVPIVSEPIPIHDKGELVTILYHEIEKRTQYGKKMVVEPFFASTNEKLSDKYREKFKDRIKKEIVHDHYSYKCGCDIINTVTGNKMGSGFGICSNIEITKTSFEEHAVISMAQTRAIGRGFKNVIGFIMKSAGYSPTPTEEMDGSKGVVFDDGASIDIKSALDGCTTVDEVMLVWKDLDSVSQSRYKTLFTKRKTQLSKK